MSEKKCEILVKDGLPCGAAACKTLVCPGVPDVSVCSAHDIMFDFGQTIKVLLSSDNIVEITKITEREPGE